MRESIRRIRDGAPQAPPIELRHSTAREVTAEFFEAKRSAIGLLKTKASEIDSSIVGGSISSSVHLRNSYTVASGGGHVRIDNSVVQWLIGGYVEARRVFALVIIGGAIRGEVRTLLTARTAVLFGIALGFSGLAARILRKLI